MVQGGFFLTPLVKVLLSSDLPSFLPPPSTYHLHLEPPPTTCHHLPPPASIYHLHLQPPPSTSTHHIHLSPPPTNWLPSKLPELVDNSRT